MSETIVLIGPYGVGKSEFAVQLALLKKPCLLADIDILNPYFRPREIADELAQGITVIGSHLKGALNQDVPALNTGFASKSDSGLPLIIDCGGSENGLRPLSGFSEALSQAEIWLVVNLSREESAVQLIRPTCELFEGQSGLKITGLVHNTHLLEFTTAELILEAQHQLEALALELDLPIRYTMIPERLRPELESRIHNPILSFTALRLRSGWMKGTTL